MEVDGDSRAERLRRAGEIYPEFKAELAEGLNALALRPWLEHPEWLTEELLPADPQERVGKTYGRWQIVAYVGGGGMGDVYEVERRLDDVCHRLALKILRDRANSPEERARLRGEFAALVAVGGHPNIIQIFEADITDDGEGYLVMELVRGCSISNWVCQEALDICQRIRLFLKVLDGLQWIHSKELAHRDIKPSNVLVTNGSPKIIDFGLATNQHTEEGPRWLTTEYASPEQRGSKTLGTQKSDQYAAGLLLRELLTGHRASIKEQDAGLSASSKTPTLSAAFRRSLKGPVDAILAKSLAQNPEDRYATVGEFRDDLDRCLRHEPVRALPITFRNRLNAFSQREKIASRTLVGLAILLVFAGVASWRAKLEQHRAELREKAVLAVTQSAIQAPLKELDNIPGTLRTREEMVRAVRNVLADLKGDTQASTGITLALARAHLKLASLSSAVRGTSTTERAAAIEDTDEALRLLSEITGSNR